MAISPYLKKLRERIGHELLVLPPVCAIVVNNRGEVLLQHSKDTNGWTTIGGMAEPGEEPADAVVREVMEEARDPRRAVEDHVGDELGGGDVSQRRPDSICGDDVSLPPGPRRRKAVRERR